MRGAQSLRLGGGARCFSARCGFEQAALGGASLSALRCAGLTRPFSRPAPATVDPEDAARAARCAAKQAELERLHAEIAEVCCFNALHSSHAPTSHGWVDTHTHTGGES